MIVPPSQRDPSGAGELDPFRMLKLGAISLQSGVWASLLQLSASVLFKSLTKLTGVSEDAQLSHPAGLGDFLVTSILCRAVFNADTLQSHWGGLARTIFGENNPHICVLWGVRSCLLCLLSKTSSLQEGRASGSLVG